MTNDDIIFREVDEALAVDKSSQTIRKNLPLIVGAALAVVIGVGGWQVYTQQRDAAAAKASAAYSEALKAGEGETADAALQALAKDGGGYATLAKLRLAGDEATKGEREKALSLFREVYDAGGGSRRLKDIARLRAAYLSLTDGREAVIKDLGDLETDQTSIGYYAREILALAAIKAGDFQAAEQMLRKATTDAKAPEPIRLRAGEFAALASAGKAGVALPAVEESKKSDVDRYLENLQKAGGDLSSVLNQQAAPKGSPQAPADEAPPQPQGQE